MSVVFLQDTLLWDVCEAGAWLSPYTLMQHYAWKSIFTTDPDWEEMFCKPASEKLYSTHLQLGPLISLLVTLPWV